MIIIIFIILLSIGAIIMFKPKKKIDSKLIFTSTISSGSMNGGRSETSIERVDDNKALYSIYNQPSHSSPVDIKEYYIDATTLDKIKAIFDKYDLQEYPKLKKSKIFAHDAATTSYEYKFENGDNIYFSSDLDLPRKFQDAKTEIKDILNKARENGEKLPNIVFQNPSDDEITLSINYYYQNTISYLIENYSDHEIEIDGIIRLYKGDYLIYEEESYSYNLNKNRDHLDCIKLENRLDVGDYLLELGDIKCSFTIN